MNRDALAAMWLDYSPLPIVPPEFADVLSACVSPNTEAIEWLTSCGVLPLAIGTPLALRTSRVAFNHRGGFAPDVSIGGEFAFVIPVDEDGEVIDLIAWSPKWGRTGTIGGYAFAIGQGDLSDDAGRTGLPVTVWRSPLGWLRADRRGLVILDPATAAFHLSDRLVSAEDDTHAGELRRALRPLPPNIIANRRLDTAA